MSALNILHTSQHGIVVIKSISTLYDCARVLVNTLAVIASIIYEFHIS
jgi:hypothetical protein